MSNPLEDLVKSIQAEKEKPVRKSQPVRRQRPQQPKRKYVKKSGAGGVIMDFGGASNMHPAFKSFEHLMNRHGDPTQSQTANHQSNQFEKALDNFVDMGEHEYAKHVQHEEIRVQEESRIGYEEAKKSYAHTETKVGRETVTATSETDAAVIEMFKAEMGEDFEGF
jgi:hypothetical protein